MTIGLQCNFCGNFETITGCVYCSAPVCARCSLNHQPICEELSKKRKAKAGATVRRVGEVPARELFTTDINQPLQITQVFPPDTPQEFLESLNADAEAHKEALLATLARAIEVPKVDDVREQKAIESFLEEVDYEPHKEAINPIAELFKILENHLSQLSDADRENRLAAVEQLIKGDRG